MRRRTLAQLRHDIGRRVCELREARGLTQAELGERVGVSEQRVQQIETGKDALSLRTVDYVCAALRVDAKELFEPPESRARRRPGRPKKR